MQSETIDNWANFDRITNKQQFRKWIYRGQSCSDWVLESSLHRAFKEAKSIYSLETEKSLSRIDHESVMVKHFKANAHLYLNHLPPPNDGLSWLALMQHYGAPTRLLDFSFSPYVALFFALEYGEKDAIVYCINRDAITQSDDKHFGENKRYEVHSRVLDHTNEEDDPSLHIFEPEFSNQRLLTQQGIFITTNTLDFTHEEILEDYEVEDNCVIKITIPAKQRLEGLKILNKMNINSSNIYPGLDGFCKDIRRQTVFNQEWQKRVCNEK